MGVQVLISAMHAEPKKLISKMNIKSDAILINQCDENGFESFCVQDENGNDRKVLAVFFRMMILFMQRGMKNALQKSSKNILMRMYFFLMWKCVKNDAHILIQIFTE